MAGFYFGARSVQEARQAVQGSGLGPPSVVTLAALGKGPKDIRFRGRIDSMGRSGGWWFEYRVTGTQAFTETTGGELQAVTGDREIEEEKDLRANTTYEYRAVAQTTAGRANGDLRSFTTAATG
jgi:hypothetical protein